MQKPRPLVSGHDFARYLTPSGRLDVDRLVSDFHRSQEHLSKSSESGAAVPEKNPATPLRRWRGEVRTYVSY